jgi:hypothetical protein
MFQSTQHFMGAATFLLGLTSAWHVMFQSTRHFVGATTIYARLNDAVVIRISIHAALGRCRDWQFVSL